MTCYHPITCYRSTVVNESGKRSVVFRRDKGFVDLPLAIPCGQCVGCRLDYARDWGTRCLHEARLYDNNCFLTLTYDDGHLPFGSTLYPDDMTLFFKRLRKFFGRDHLRYYYCGEYGDQHGRPHYHALIFGVEFSDLIFFKKINGYDYYISPKLQQLWGKGFCTVGNVTWNSAAYVARYILKKQKGLFANDDLYLDKETGQMKLKEFARMSRRGAIGKEYARKFLTDFYPSDQIVLPDGGLVRPPKLYDSILEVDMPDLYAIVKDKRAMHVRENPLDREVLDRKEEYKLAQSRKLMRPIHGDENV